MQASEIVASNVPPNPTLPVDAAASADPRIPAGPIGHTGPTGPTGGPSVPLARRASNGKLYTPKPRGRDVGVQRKVRAKRPGCDHPGCYRGAVWAMGLLIPIPTVKPPEEKAPEAPAEPVVASAEAPAALAPTPIPAVPTGILGFGCEKHRESLIDRDNVAAHPSWAKIAEECRNGFGHDPDPKTATVRLVKIA